jgi:hypothetical protein
MKDIYTNMAGQNILTKSTPKFDLKLDFSEYYDYTLSNEGDYDLELLSNHVITYDNTLFDSNCSGSLVTPTTFVINTGNTYGDCDFNIRKRTEKGWTAGFVFNKQGHNWSDANTFYYWGISDETDPLNYIDNNLSFQFTNDGCVKWVSNRYSGSCDPSSGYTSSYYISSGQTEQLCTNGTSADFYLTISFERNYFLHNCQIENEGGSNDMIQGPHLVPITYDPVFLPSGDTTGFLSGSVIGHADLIATGYTMTTGSLNWLTGDTQYTYVEELNKKWSASQEKRLGTLKIYLNGERIYKLDDWEEIIPSQRSSVNQMVQIWGGGTTGSNNLHINDTLFELKSIEYYEQPLSFPQINQHYKSVIKPNNNITECYDPCTTNVSIYSNNAIIQDNNSFILVDNGSILTF